ncbi:hypothetical protein OH77DRAFT_1495041 [Trametes cingulata]|nr:hypothetical protein OH77DRAFT_1495041 [Trametes cingulata]
MGTSRPARNSTANPDWYPWPDKQSCVLDIVRHLPRSLFSDSQMEIILWCLGVLGVDNVPSLFVLKTLDKMLQSHCGITSIRHRGPLGHIYYVNELAAILAQEMANPRVRPNLHFFPEDAGSRMKEAWHAARWLREMSPDVATPMVRIGQQDFYVNEPSKLEDGRVVIPRRWFFKATHPGVEPVLHGEGWLLHAVTFQGSRRGYVVHEQDVVAFPGSMLSLSLPLMIKTYESDRLPDPRAIIGRVVAGEAGVHPWTYTDPEVGNPWRARAKGHRVVSLPLWLYCDDTSGNMSKKWNKHNSWLLTLAGLPRELAQQENNVHFLATSNIAPPLEMLHGIVSQLEQGQTEGFWAWDVIEQEMVLMIPAVLAILGDNPMQSELSCHVGLTGKLFCRNCMVRGKERADGERMPHGKGRAGEVSNGSDSSAPDVSASSTGEGGGQERGTHTRLHKETMQELIDRARRFLGNNDRRRRDKTLEVLENIFQKAATVGGMTGAKKLKTEHGVKDTFQDFFLQRIFAFGRKLRGSHAEKQLLLDAFVAQEIPDDILSPVWRIKDLDPHQDTPVEILHVVLLGFIKYFWRDAIARIPSDKKELLKTRLASLDVSGLGIAPLSGETLVTYAGSLTGRDFRTVSQVAPFVLYDLVPQPCYQAWQSLSALVPLIWQPEIRDIEEHLERLQAAIDYFLDCTAQWTPRWFNKPKFHVLRHLVDHIRRFGPAVLFATEGFESFNAIIRSKSVHSNHQAPSRDIAYGFARANRTRHLLSGGVFLPRADDNPDHWKSAGRLPLALTDLPHVGTRTCTLTNGRAVQAGATMTAVHAQPLPFPPLSYVWKCSSFVDQGGDSVQVSSWVLLPDPAIAAKLCIGRVAEILQVHDSNASRSGRADIVLIERFVCADTVAPYGVPRLCAAGWKAIDPKDVLCTVNVQHNCAAHGCGDTGRTAVFQERERAASTRATVMRSAVHLQQLRRAQDPLDREKAILAGARAEIGRKPLRASPVRLQSPVQQAGQLLVEQTCSQPSGRPPRRAARRLLVPLICDDECMPRAATGTGSGGQTFPVSSP